MRKDEKKTRDIKIIVAELLRKNPNSSAPYLKKETDKRLKKKKIFFDVTPRTYFTYKQEILKNNMINQALDQQWSISDCEKYNIPDNMIPIIMERKKILGGAYGIIDYSGPPDPHDDDGWMEIEEAPMTIRVARWMSRLKPSVDILIEKFKNEGLDVEGMIDNASPEEIIRQKDSFLYWLLYNIAQVYAKLEGISEYLGYEHFDSCVADEYFFMKDYKNWGKLDTDVELADLILLPKLKDKADNINTDKEKQKSKAKKTGAEG